MQQLCCQPSSEWELRQGPARCLAPVSSECLLCGLYGACYTAQLQESGSRAPSLSRNSTSRLGQRAGSQSTREWKTPCSWVLVSTSHEPLLFDRSRCRVIPDAGFVLNGVSVLGPILVSDTLSLLCEPQALLIPQGLPALLGLMHPREALVLIGQSAALSQHDVARLQRQCRHLGIRAEIMSTVSKAGLRRSRLLQRVMSPCIL